MKSALLTLVIIATAAACGGKVVRDDYALDSQYHQSEKASVQEMINRVTEFNNRASRFLSAEFILDGAQRDKKFRVIGNLQYDRESRAMHAAFYDYIFKSPVLVFFVEKDVIHLYYPAEKKLFVDKMKGFDLADYGGPGMSIDLLLTLATGGIPMIDGYHVKQGLDANDGNGSMLLLESSRYFETLSFREDRPDKILLIDRNSRDRFEIYLKKSVDRAEGTFFSNIILVSTQPGLRIDIRFNNMQWKGPVTVKTVRDLKLPPGVRIITNR